MLLENDLDALVHHLLELLAEEFVLEAHLLREVLLLPLGELVEFLDERLQLLVLDLEIVLLFLVCQVGRVVTHVASIFVILVVVVKHFVIAGLLPVTLSLLSVGIQLLVLLCEHLVERLL